MKLEHHKAIQNRLVKLASLGAKTDATEAKILEAAQHRLESVESQIKQTRPRAILDDKAGERYQALVLERGRLNLVIAQARARS
jgi:hypothetical protein